MVRNVLTCHHHVSAVIAASALPLRVSLSLWFGQSSYIDAEVLVPRQALIAQSIDVGIKLLSSSFDLIASTRKVFRYNAIHLKKIRGVHLKWWENPNRLEICLAHLIELKLINISH